MKGPQPFTTDDTEGTEKGVRNPGRLWRHDAASFEAHWIGTAVRSRECRYRSDGAEAISQASNQARIRPRAVLRLAVPAGRKAQSGFRPELAALHGRLRAAGTGGIWLRVEPRARAVGACGLRFSGSPRAELRRYFLQQLFPERDPTCDSSRCSDG